MNKKDLKKLLEEVGGLRHYLNLLDTAERDPEMSLAIGVGDYLWGVTPEYDGWKDWMNSIVLEHPWGVSLKSRRKYLRKILAAEEAKGREGLLEILEKKNAALRRYLWEEVIEDQNP